MISCLRFRPTLGCDTIAGTLQATSEAATAMSTVETAADDRPGLPPLWKDRAYHGMNFTQFFGAFNDNLFKQLVLLICVNYAGTGRDYQMVAQALFALPFVLFSGFAGFLADRISKQRIVVAMKVAEVGVMTAGFLAFHLQTGQLPWLLVVVFLMGTHRPFFGPPKYGILPELFRESDLPQVNGMIQMTTFLAIICGAAAAGLIKEWYPGQLWIGSAVCMGIALTGTLTALLVRRTPIARPGLPFTPSALFLGKETWRMIRSDRPLFQVLIVSSLFWFLGGVIQPSVNAFGKTQLEYGDGRTSVMVVCMAIGIMFGCIWAGQTSGGRIRFDFVKRGAWGIVACLAGVAAMGAIEGPTFPAKPLGVMAQTKIIELNSLEDSSRDRRIAPGRIAGPDARPRESF